MATIDPRHLALILRAGHRAAENMQDAGLSAALDAMAEMAAWYAEFPVTDGALRWSQSP